MLALPAINYDTARVVYRVVDVEGFVAYERNSYSVPWRLVGELLVVRITESELIVYNSSEIGVSAGGHTTLDYIPGTSLLGAFVTAFGIAPSDPRFARLS